MEDKIVHEKKETAFLDSLLFLYFFLVCGLIFFSLCKAREAAKNGVF
jgi:hypothetical protein